MGTRISKERRLIYLFGVFCLDADELLLFKDGRVVRVAPRAVEILLVLVQNRDRVVGTGTPEPGLGQAGCQPGGHRRGQHSTSDSRPSQRTWRQPARSEIYRKRTRARLSVCG